MDTTHPQYQDQLRAIGQQVHAPQHGAHSGPAAAVVAVLLSNVDTLAGDR